MLIFNHPAWFEVLRKTYSINIKIFNGSEFSGYNSFLNLETGIPFAILKDKYVSLPFSDYINLKGKKEINDKIMEKLVERNPKVKIEIRDKYEGNGFKNKIIGYKHYLSLSINADEIFSKFKKTQVQQPIQKSIKDGLKYVIKTDYHSINEFYKLHILTRKKLGVPIQPKKFFFNLWDEIINKGLGFVVLVTFNDEIVSSGIFLGVDKIVTYKFSASNPAYLKYRPNNLMLWAAILEAKSRGYKIFDFGRTDLENEGLRKFKLGWGTVEEPLYYSYFPEIPDKSKFNFIKNRIVSPIIKHSPKIICRLSGELFYKYFG